MIIQKVALFGREEAHTIRAAQRSINIAFPTDGPGAVAEDDPRRSVLRGLSSVNDALTVARLERGKAVLDQLLQVITAQADRDYWLIQLGQPSQSPLAQRDETMVQTLVDARSIQRREVLIASMLINRTLELLGDEDDGPLDVLEDILDAVHDSAQLPGAEQASDA